MFLIFSQNHLFCKVQCPFHGTEMMRQPEDILSVAKHMQNMWFFCSFSFSEVRRIWFKNKTVTYRMVLMAQIFTDLVMDFLLTFMGI